MISTPQHLWIVRHGQSAGNVARDAAEAAQHVLIDVATRDMDSPLSELGMQQSHALADWFAAMEPGQRPTLVLCSPYMRARQTAVIIAERLSGAAGGAGPRLLMDERLREKEFGQLDRLTIRGIAQKYPELAEQRKHVGKFYFRPPGGESWCDVILRLRSLCTSRLRDHSEERVLCVAHQVIVNCLRYVLEDLDEEAILNIDRAGDVPNCAVTSYRREPAPSHRLLLELVNFVAPLQQSGTPVTSRSDTPAAPKS